MTLQQLEYIVALDNHRQFSAAAAHCHVSQPSLSALVQKLEEELGVKLFDRSRQPIAPTEIGQEVIAQARRVLDEAEHLKLVVGAHCNTLSGALRIGIIPTLAPYLLPLFLKNFAEQYPNIELTVRENTTSQLLQKLKLNQIDAALLATPTEEDGLQESVLFYEEFAVYAPNERTVQNKNYLLAEDIDANRLLLLEEGHCMRNQVSVLCALQRSQRSLQNVTYEAGSLETLKRLVEAHSGITVLPQLALLDLTEEQTQFVRFFYPPAPVREISLVSRNLYAKRQLLDALKRSIVDSLPSFMREDREKKVLPIMYS